MRKRLAIPCLLWTVAAAAAVACLRLWPVLGRTIWFDEIYTLKIASATPSQIASWSRFDVHPALYYLWLHLFVDTGRSIGGVLQHLWWLRLGSILPALGLTALLASWGRACGRGLTAWTVAGLSLAVPGLAFYSLEIRNYTLVMFFVAAAGFALVALLHRPRPLPMLAFVLAGLGMVYTHNLAAVVLALNFAWMALHFPALLRRFGSRRALLLPLAVVLTIVGWLPQLLLIREQYYMRYKPWEWVFPRIEPMQLFSVFFYEFPAGPNVSQTWRTPFGLLVVYLMLVLTVLLVVRLRRGSRFRSPGSPARASLHYCLFALFGYIVSTWAVTMAGWGILFSSDRLAMIVLPLWLMTAALLIERLVPSRTRRVGRLLLIGLMLPCAGLSLWQRITLRDDLRPRIGEIDRLAAERNQNIRVYLLEDDFQPWVRHHVRGWTIHSLDELLAAPAEPGRYHEAMLMPGMQKVIASDRDSLLLALLERLAPDDPRIERVDGGSYARYRIDPDALPDVQRLLTARLPDFLRRVVRAHDHLHLPAFAREFVWAVGLEPPEAGGDTVMRWMSGPRQQIFWRAPAAGRYLLRLSSWRPGPFPRATVDVRLRVGRGHWQTFTAPVGTVTVELPVTVSASQSMSLEIEAETWRPADFIEGVADRRELSLSFVSLEMVPQPPSAP